MKTLLTYAEASAELTARGLPIAAGTLQNWKCCKKIAVRKLGGKVRIPMSEIDRLIERSEIRAIV